MSRECPSCATEISPINGACPICGYEFPDKPRWSIKFVAIIMTVILLYPLIKLIRFILDI